VLSQRLVSPSHSVLTLLALPTASRFYPLVWRIIMDTATALLGASTALGIAANTVTTVTIFKAFTELIFKGRKVGFLSKDAPAELIVQAERHTSTGFQHMFEVRFDIDPEERRNFYKRYKYLLKQEDKLRESARKIASTSLLNIRERREYYVRCARHLKDATAFAEQAYTTSNRARYEKTLREEGLSPYVGPKWDWGPTSCSTLSLPIHNDDFTVVADPTSSAASLCETLAEEVGISLDEVEQRPDSDAESLSSILDNRRHWEIALLERILDIQDDTQPEGADSHPDSDSDSDCTVSGCQTPSN
ncbi:hypothetical protein BXZ70DRAFT_1013835, partial [Cristinia sonorae]